MSERREGRDFRWVLGGTLRRDEPSYITRPADAELLRLTQAGEYCNVLAPRQMGKSSLMVRTVERLKAEGVRMVVIDLTAIGADVTVEEWYFGLVSRISRQLRLDSDEQAWWQARAERSPVQRFTEYLHDVALAEVREPIVVFIDEIDSTLRLKFTDDFFAAIRSMYNARATEPAYQRLTFVLLGVARAADLVKDRTRTPYNIGTNIDLTDITYEEASRVFAPALDASHPGQGVDILRWALAWTGGQPYLTQKLCAEAASSPNGTIAETDVDAMVERLFLTDEARKESNLQAIRDRVLSSHYLATILKVYRKVLRGQRVVDEERSVEKNELKLTGLVRATPQATLAVRNRVYAYVFDLAWVKANLPPERYRRLAVGAVAAAAVAVAVLILFVLNQGNIQAQQLVDQFNTTSSPEVRISSLAQLFGVDAARGRGLYFGLSQDEQVALFGLENPQNVGTELVTVVNGLYQYPRCQNRDAAGTARLEAMRDALRPVNDAAAFRLADEIDDWLRGRELAGGGQTQSALERYGSAWEASEREGRANPSVLYERAVAHAAEGEHDAALADLEAALGLDADCGAAIVPLVTGNPALAARRAEQPDQYPVLAAALPAPTATPEVTPAATLLETPGLEFTRTPTPAPIVGITSSQTDSQVYTDASGSLTIDQVLPSKFEVFVCAQAGERYLVAVSESGCQLGDTLGWIDVGNIQLVSVEQLPEQLVTPVTATSAPRVVTSPTPSRTPTPSPTPPIVIEFWADRALVNFGECTFLNWKTDNVDAVYLDEEGVAGSDSRQICPKTTTTYVLRVVHPLGTETRQVTVQVNPPTPTPTVTPIPEPTEVPLPPLPVSDGGLITIEGVQIQGQGRRAHAAPGSAVTVNVSYFIRDAGCPGCIDQILIGIADDATINEPKGCVYNGIPGPVGVRGSGSLTFSVPAAPGVYYVRFHYGQDFSCQFGWWGVGGVPGPDRSIGAIIVP